MVTRSRNKVQLPDKSVLTNDPSMTGWGWAVVSFTGEVYKAGIIETKPKNKVNRTRKGDDNVRRVNEIANTLFKVIKDCNVAYIVSELPHGSQNSAGATMIGVVMGVLESFSVTLGMGVEWYSENDSKNAVLGKGSAYKEEMIIAIQKKYPNIIWGKSKKWKEAVADAMAIYHTATLQSPIIKAIGIVQKNGQ